MLPSRVPLIQRRGIQDLPVGTIYKVVCKVRRVVKGELAPAVNGVGGVETEPRERLTRGLQRVEAVVVSRGAIGDVPRRRGVVELGAVDDAISQRRLTLVDVGVAGEDEVDAVVDEERFEDVLACPANGAGGVGVREVPGSVAGDDDPGGLGAVDGC